MTVAIQIFISGKLLAAALAQAFGIWYANAREIMKGRAALAQPEQQRLISASVNSVRMGRSATRVSAFARMRSNSIMTGLDRTRARFSSLVQSDCLSHGCRALGTPVTLLEEFCTSLNDGSPVLIIGNAMPPRDLDEDDEDDEEEDHDAEPGVVREPDLELFMNRNGRPSRAAPMVLRYRHLAGH